MLTFNVILEKENECITLNDKRSLSFILAIAERGDGVYRLLTGAQNCLLTEGLNCYCLLTGRPPVTPSFQCG